MYGRVGLFLGSMYRQMGAENRHKYDNYIVVTHGLLMRMFLMRYFGWTVSEFESEFTLSSSHPTTTD